MKENFKFIISWILIIFVLGFCFYWYEWRPTQIRKNCIKQIEAGDYKITGGDLDIKDHIELLKEFCLLEKGINE